MSEWISVKDDMPEQGRPVLVVYHGVVQHVCYALWEDDWEDSSGDGDSMPKDLVTHWMPLPEPPK